MRGRAQPAPPTRQSYPAQDYRVARSEVVREKIPLTVIHTRSRWCDDSGVVARTRGFTPGHAPTVPAQLTRQTPVTPGAHADRFIRFAAAFGIRNRHR